MLKNRYFIRLKTTKTSRYMKMVNHFFNTYMTFVQSVHGLVQKFLRHTYKKSNHYLARDYE